MDQHPRVSAENYTEYLLCIDEAARYGAISAGALAVEGVSEFVIKLPEIVQLGGWAVAAVAGVGAAYEGFSAWLQRDPPRSAEVQPNHTEPSGEVDWDKRREEYFAAKRARLEEANRPDEPGVVTFGANAPNDPDLWVADWREALPPGDPLRESGPPIVKVGSPEAYAKMRAANSAIRQAYGLSPENE
jgi:hypothetical protein